MISKQTLYEKLIELRDSDCYPFHMRGHKRNPGPGAMSEYYGIDITEIDGFDNLHEAKGILRDIELEAAVLYGAKDAFMSVNGSTAGILSAIMSQTRRGDTVLMARGCHKSVYHALYLQELEAHYLLPEEMLPAGIPGEITAAQVARGMDENPACRAVIITSPTYEGLVMDIESIAGEVHARGGLLIVDAAHGAHLGFSEAVPKGPIEQGADLAVVSLHKTMPAMTQTALVLVGSDRPDKARLKRYLSMVQTSSPSYVLMASIQESLRFAEREGNDALQKMAEACRKLTNIVNTCRYIRIYGGKSGFPDCGTWDPGKLVIAAPGGACSGYEIYRFLLEEHHLQLEMAAEKYALAIMTMADRSEAYERLEKALFDLDKKLACGEQKADTYIIAGMDPDGADAAGKMLPVPETVYPLWKAMDEETREIALADSAGSVAAEFVGLYPPGIPILVPGERIGREHRDLLQEYLRQRLHVEGIKMPGIQMPGINMPGITPRGTLRVCRE